MRKYKLQMSKSFDVASKFCCTKQWDSATWLATTYQWHPTSEMPPVMGLVFADWPKGIELFKSWVDAVGNVDAEDDLRVAILEGYMPGQAPGYTIRISPSLNEYLDEDDDGRNYIGRVMRMHPPEAQPPGSSVPKAAVSAEPVIPSMMPNLPGNIDMLARFKEEYKRHGEFMLAPVVQRDDNQLYMNVHQGIIKRELVIRHVSEIGENEPDMFALRECDDDKVIARATEQIQKAFEQVAEEAANQEDQGASSN